MHFKDLKMLDNASVLEDICLNSNMLFMRQKLTPLKNLFQQKTLSEDVLPKE